MKKKLLFEDVMNFNKWVSGIASREQNPQHVTLKDLFNKTTEQHPNDAVADKPLPYPLPNVIEQIGNLYVNAYNAKMQFDNALNNPVVMQNEAAKKSVLFIKDELTKITDSIKRIIGATQKPVEKK